MLYAVYEVDYEFGDQIGHAVVVARSSIDGVRSVLEKILAPQRIGRIRSKDSGAKREEAGVIGRIWYEKFYDISKDIKELRSNSQ